MAYYSEDELKNMNFKYLGKGIMLSKLANIYNPEKTELGDMVRIDDYCTLMGKIKLGNYVHIAMYSHIGGTTEGVVMEEHSECAYRCTIITHSSDYSLETLHAPCVPDELKKGRSGMVRIGKFVLLGYNTLVMPGVSIGEGCSTGAFTYVNRDLMPWGLYEGKPACFVRMNSKKCIENEVEFNKYLNIIKD